MSGVAKSVVWVVDDSQLDAERTRRVLNDECVVEVFLDGSAALERLTTAPPPAVMVLDWMMPGVTGVDVCRFLRSAQGGHPEVGILLLTAHRHTEQIVEGLSAGANDYLAKPYADAELLARVRSLLRTRQLLERAEQAEALNFKLLQTAPDALIALDETHRIKFINEAARAALPQATERFLGRSLAELLPDLFQRLPASAAHDSVLPLPDVKIGERVFSPTLRMLPEGKTFNTIISLRDVTERRRLDERRLDFYSIVAHDLRSPLSNLMLRTQLMLSGKHGDLPPTIQQDLKKIDGNLQSLVMLINDFLDLARLDNAAYKIGSEKIDMNQLLLETMETFRPQLEARALRWAAAIEEPTTVIGDSRRLQQVLTNLISNAVKFSHERGTITTCVTRSAHAVEVSVADTGRGIAPQNLSALFERYTRATDAEDRIPGTGLGLMIVREIIEAHGGSVGVESAPGEGSRFWFRMPSAEANA